jgi:threonine-phosphate decarboxylase
VVVPTFTEYERAVRADGGEVVPFLLREEDGFLPGPAPETGARLLFLCNPNNPTGRIWPRDRLLEWLEACHRQRATAVVDEAYMDFVEEGLRFSAVRWLDRFPRLIVLRSMTKSFAVPGLRLGYLAASEQIVSELGGIQPPWPVNGPAALAGRWLAGQTGYLEESRRSVRVFRQGLQEQLQGLPALRYVPSEANFILCRLAEPVRGAGWLAAALADRGILIRTCDDFTGLEKERFVRIAVRRPEQNERLLRALEEILNRAG